VVDQLAHGFEQAGHQVMLWTTGDSTCPVPSGHILAAAQGEPVGVAAVELDHVIAGYEALTTWGADIVHDHTLTGPLCAERSHPPVVVTNHGPFEGERAAHFRRVAQRMPVVAISHDQARRAGPIPVAAVIHHGVDPDAYPAGLGAGDDQGPYFLFLGRIDADTGADHAARAVHQAGGRLLIAGKVHEDHEDRFFAEHLEPLLGDDVVYAEVGDLVHKPRDQWHTFWNAGDEPCRILEIIAPGGFEDFFDELVDANLAGAPELEWLADLGARYGLEFDFESVPPALRAVRRQLRLNWTPALEVVMPVRREVADRAWT
jgi:hypothetical protein